MSRHLKIVLIAAVVAYTAVMFGEPGATPRRGFSSQAKTPESYSWMGTWVLDLSRSQIVTRVPKGRTVSMEGVGDDFRMVSDTVDYQGVASHFEFVASYDGREVEMKPIGARASLTRIDDRTILLVFDSGVKTNNRLTVSGDENSLTWTRDGELNGTTMADKFVFSRRAGEPSTADNRADINNAENEPTSRFEVAAIKPNKSPTIVQGGTCHGIDGQGVTSVAVPRGRCIFIKVGVNNLISEAYGVQTLLNDPMKRFTGYPSWVEGERFDVDAKAEKPEAATRNQLRFMLRTLLTERFKLAFHHETKETNAYGLVVTKNGSRLHAAKEITIDPVVRRSQAEGTLVMRNVTVQLLAQTLSLALQTPVLNETGISGNFDVDLKWVPPVSGSNGNDDIGGAIDRALQEQLGLRVESGRKTSIPIFVVDHLEKPAENH